MNTRVKISFSILYLVITPVDSFLLSTIPTVKVSEGLLSGTQFVSKGGRAFSAFIGIPFAEKPIGSLRFSNPVPKIPWSGIRSAHIERNECPQRSISGNIVGNEDCLYLNVYSPVLDFSSSMVSNTFKGKLLPVMVWIHGGAFFMGSGGPSKFGPTYLLDKDIILVTMNYRLGSLGFLSTGDSVAPGNFGLKDQRAALKWIKRNIHVFGGDKSRVTIFGESAGGASVNLHAISDSSNGLFQQYIIQSGSALAPWAYRTRNHMQKNANRLAKKVGCPINNSTAVIKCLRKVNVHKLMTPTSANFSHLKKLVWLPTDEPESKEAFLTDSPKNLIKQGKLKSYPVISGNVADEGIIDTLPFYIKANTEPINDYTETRINKIAHSYVPTEDAPKFRKIIKDYYFKKKNISHRPKKMLEQLTEFVSDSLFVYPQIVVVNTLKKKSKHPVYYYMFNYRGSPKLKKLNLELQETFGAMHSGELLYLFPIIPITSFSKEDKFVIDIMVDFWTSFAKNGKPTSGLLAHSNMWKPFSKKEFVLEIINTLKHTDRSDTLHQDNFTDRMNLWKKNFPII